MGQTTPFSGRGSRNTDEDDPRPNILQLNTEGLTENKIFVIEQLPHKNKAFIIVLQETHCTTADKQCRIKVARGPKFKKHLKSC